MTKFYYHPKGSDTNGNDGPIFRDGGWTELEAENYTQAVAEGLPTKEQEKVNKELADYYRGEEDDIDLVDPIGKLIADSAGWGLEFTLAAEWEIDDLYDESNEALEGEELNRSLERQIREATAK